MVGREEQEDDEL